LSLDGHGSATIVDENGPDFDDMPVLTVSDAGETVEGDNEFPATFLVELDKEVDGLLTYTFNLNVEGYGEGSVTYSAEMEDFLANGNLTVTYTVGEGDDAVSPSTAVSAVDGTVDIPGNAYNISVSVDTFNDDIFEGTESFGLDVHVDGEIGDELDELSLDGHGSATITDELDGEDDPDFEDKPTLTVSDSPDVIEGERSVFGVELSNEVDGELEYTFNLNVEGSADLADFTDVGDLTVSYTDDDNVEHIQHIENGGSLFFAGGILNLTVSVGTHYDGINEEAETFALDVNVSGDIGDLPHDLDLDASGSGTIINKNAAPEAEDFEAYLRDPDSPIPIVFDSDDPEFDHIWDFDETIPGNTESVMVMITSLPTTGTLFYTEEIDGLDVRRELTINDLYTQEDGGTILDPSKIEYEQDEGDTFVMGGMPEDLDSVEGPYNWGDWESNTERSFELSNGATILISLIDNNPNSKGKAEFKQYEHPDNHKGFGLAENHGKGMNPKEQIVINLSENPLETVTFGIDGMQNAFIRGASILVTYTLQDGTEETVEYNKSSDLGSQEFYEQFTYTSEDNPIVGMVMEGTGSNWVLRDLSGEEAITEDDSFTYLAIDTGGLVSEEATVTIPPYVEHAASLEDELLSGTEDTDAFKWSDTTIDNGEDTIENFTLYEDLIDLTGVLDDDPEVSIGELMDVVTASVVDDDVVLTVNAANSDDIEVTQTIVIEDGATILDDFIPANSELDQLELLSQILKTDAA
ncbi:hypothetical protein L4C54_20475, partial [Vibrio lamellibrachiae]|uniref:hypothetical protein n=1 Tax=Vibrio lamellibrachiae TaxID=2910253 RepID=UPI003D0C6638